LPNAGIPGGLFGNPAGKPDDDDDAQQAQQHSVQRECKANFDKDSKAKGLVALDHATPARPGHHVTGDPEKDLQNVLVTNKLLQRRVQGSLGIEIRED
jgi:hypothetical protein